MKERPIIFSTDMVLVILEGRKTQTRRVVTPSTSEVGEGKVDWSKFCWDGSQIYQDTCHHGHTEEHKAPLPFVDGRANEHYPYEHQYLHIPYNWRKDMTIYRIYPRWEVGDRLWVRETWATENQYNHLKPSEVPRTATIYYLASINYDPFGMGVKRPSIFMPRWASRITLEITNIRVERLLEITEVDAKAEGDPKQGLIASENDHRAWFLSEWDFLNAKRGYGWETNPWVWVVEFEHINHHLDPMGHLIEIIKEVTQK